MMRATRRQVLGSGLALGAMSVVDVPGSSRAETANPVAGWTYTDFLGRVTTLPAPPSRIAAEISTAATLYDMGIQVHSVWGGPANDPEGVSEAWGRLPVDSVVNIADSDGNPDPEKALAAGTDLFLFGAIELEDPSRYSEDDTPYALLPQIAPIVVWSFLDRVDRSAEAIWQVAMALGADRASPQNVAAQAELDVVVADLQANLAKKANLTALFGYPTPDEIYIANPLRWDDVNYFRYLGLNVVDIDPSLVADWWETLSWEEALTYETDMAFLAGESGALTLEQLREHPTFRLHPAMQANQAGRWSWYFARSPQGITQLLENVLAVLRDAEDVTG